MSTLARTHSIERTSPKGPGQKFIGTCTLCGKKGLTFKDMDEECPNQRELTKEEALIEAIGGPEPRSNDPPADAGLLSREEFERLSEDAQKARLRLAEAERKLAEVERERNKRERWAVGYRIRAEAAEALAEKRGRALKQAEEHLDSISGWSVTAVIALRIIRAALAEEPANV